eukprot:52580-Eustigmatos_ZCMA.PRE.1
MGRMGRPQTGAVAGMRVARDAGGEFVCACCLSETHSVGSYVGEKLMRGRSQGHERTHILAVST